MDDEALLYQAKVTYHGALWLSHLEEYHSEEGLLGSI
jgi:hypothetical protein